MQLSHNGIANIEDLEGFRNGAYKDAVGIWTIGFGTTHINGKPVQEGMLCSRAEGERYLAQDTAAAQTAINQLVKYKLTQNMFDALVSFVYNVGIGAFTTSTLLRKLNNGDFDGAAAEFLRWDKAGGKPLLGLTKRRTIERARFLA